MTLSSCAWSTDAWCQPMNKRSASVSVGQRTEARVKPSYLVDLVGQLGQNGDAYDAVLHAVL